MLLNSDPFTKVGVMALLKFAADQQPPGNLWDGRLFAAISCAICCCPSLGATLRTSYFVSRGSAIGGLLGWAAVAAARDNIAGLYAVLVAGSVAINYSSLIPPVEAKLVRFSPLLFFRSLPSGSCYFLVPNCAF